jgi:hypothetical protein
MRAAQRDGRLGFVTLILKRAFGLSSLPPATVNLDQFL